jgi:hypothetical protein
MLVSLSLIWLQLELISSLCWAYSICSKDSAKNSTSMTASLLVDSTYKPTSVDKDGCTTICADR